MKAYIKTCGCRRKEDLLLIHYSFCNNTVLYNFKDKVFVLRLESSQIRNRISFFIFEFVLFV